VSELFRIQLCRNDDHNLAQSTILKNLSLQSQGTSLGNKKALQNNKEKLISDMKSREEDRVKREKDILISLKGEKNSDNLL
jgi:hypothetical protein